MISGSVQSELFHVELSWRFRNSLKIDSLFLGFFFTEPPGALAKLRLADWTKVICHP